MRATDCRCLLSARGGVSSTSEPCPCGQRVRVDGTDTDCTRVSTKKRYAAAAELHEQQRLSSRRSLVRSKRYMPANREHDVDQLIRLRASLRQRKLQPPSARPPPCRSRGRRCARWRQTAHRDIALGPDDTSRRLLRPRLAHHGPARLFSAAVPRPRDWVGAGWFKALNLV